MFAVKCMSFRVIVSVLSFHKIGACGCVVCRLGEKNHWTQRQCRNDVKLYLELPPRPSTSVPEGQHPL